MKLIGKQVIQAAFTAEGMDSFNGYNPVSERPLDDIFFEATEAEVNAACEAAARAFLYYKAMPGKQRAIFLETIAQEILNLGDALIATANIETGLPIARLMGERGRTVGQLHLFANLLKEGSWVNAIIDTADPERQPLPKPDIRQVQLPLGPIAVFGASNFPLAFSVAGGDTVSALAAGCPVVFKAHPAHPGTCELVATAIVAAIEKCNMPKGVFAMLHGASHQVGGWLVQHAAIKAVGFTGSFAGGKALYDLVTKRPEPIPIYAEMGSVNPVFFLPEILKEKSDELARQFVSSITLGAGQFCTNPGMFVLPDDEISKLFLQQLTTALQEAKVGPLLTPGIKSNYLNGVKRLDDIMSITRHTNWDGIVAHPQLFTVNADAVFHEPSIVEEVFGPCSVGVFVHSKAELLDFATALRGQLTATVHGTENDLAANKELFDILKEKAGRVIVNGFPTGVEVTHAMVHGGPFPATSDSRSTSVGTSAIYRFTRPVCFQDFPDFLLPDALKESNPLAIIRTINGKIYLQE